MTRTVFYIDPPAFCATVERLVAPDLRSRPLAVAPPGADRATILALSAEARLAGIERGMLVRLARKLCPDLVLLPPNPRLYARASRALTEILRVYAPVIEPRGYGHAFLDLSGTERLFGPAVDLAERIRRESRERLGLPLTVGVAINKLVSEAAVRSDRRTGGQADRRTGPADRESAWIRPGTEAEFLAPNPLDVLPGIPGEILTRLDEYQLELIGQIAAIGENGLAAVFGRRGRLLAAQARGIDSRPVLAPEIRAEYRVSHTLATDSNDRELLGAVLRPLVRKLGRRLRERRFTARRLAVQVDYADYDHSTRAVPLNIEPLDWELEQAARRALALALTRRIAVRMLTVTVDRLVENNPQLELFAGGRADGRTGGQADRRTGGQVDRLTGPQAGALQRAIDAVRRVKSGLPGKNDLAHAPVRLHLPVGRGDLRHGKDRVHHRPEGLGPPLRPALAAERLFARDVGPEAGQHPDPELGHQRAPLAQFPAPHHAAHHGKPLAQDEGKVRLRRDRPLQQAQEDQPTPGNQHHQVVGQRRAAQHIEDQIHRGVELVPERLAAGIDAPIHPQPLQGSQLARGPGGPDHGGAELAGQLNRGGAHPAGGGVDHNPLSRLEIAPQGERVPGGEKRLGNRRRIGYRKLGGRRKDLVLVHHHELGVGPAPDQPHYRLARLPAGYAGAHPVHLSGILQPRYVGRPAGGSRIASPPLENVGPVEPGRPNPDPDLPSAGLGIRRVAERQNFGPAAPAVHNGFHDDGGI